MKKRVKGLSRATALGLCVVLLAGCGKSTTNGADTALPDPVTEARAEEPGWKDDTDPITIDWYINYSWYSSLWDEGLYSQYIEEKTGVKVNFIVPAGNEEEKLNTMIAGDTLPDIITLYAQDPAINQLVEAGKLYSVNDLADAYDPYFYEVTSAETLAWFAMEDGKTYGYPNSSISPSEYDEIDLIGYQTFNVKQDYYEAIGSPDMSTPEGFLSALQAAKDQFGTVNGQPLIPIGLHEFTDVGNLSLDSFLLNYLGVPYEIDGQLYDRREDSNYLEWLKTFRKANEMGLLSDDVFIDTRLQLEEKVAQKRYFSLLYQNCDFTTGQQLLYQEDPNSAYIAIQGPNSGNDPTIAGPSISGWTLTCVTKNAKNVERCIEFMTYLMSAEGTSDITFGEVGVSCQVDENGTPSLTEEYQKLYDDNKEEYDKLTGSDPLWMLYDQVLYEAWKPAVPVHLQQMYYWSKPYMVSHSVYENLNPGTNTDEGEALAEINLLWGQTLPSLIRAASDEEFDRIFADYISQRDTLGWDKLLAYQQARFEENKVKLGLTE